MGAGSQMKQQYNVRSARADDGAGERSSVQDASVGWGSSSPS